MFRLTFKFNNFTDYSSLSSFSSSPSKTPVDVPWLLLKFIPPAFPGDLELEDGTEEDPELFDDIEIIIKDGDVGEICEAFYCFFIDQAVQNCFGERTGIQELQVKSVSWPSPLISCYCWVTGHR